MATPTKRASARDRLLAAADELFYEEGIHAVGIDRVIERAGVAKGSLYYIFGSKDELVAAYLRERHAKWVTTIDQGVAHLDTPRDRILGVFDVLSDLFHRPGYHGCAFMNASAEARPGGPEAEVVEEFRTWLRTFFIELSSVAGASDPKALAEQLTLLYDGASVASQMDKNLDATRSARLVAAALIDEATNGQAGTDQASTSPPHSRTPA